VQVMMAIMVSRKRHVEENGPKWILNAAPGRAQKTRPASESNPQNRADPSPLLKVLGYSYRIVAGMQHSKHFLRPSCGL